MRQLTACAALLVPLIVAGCTQNNVAAPGAGAAISRPASTTFGTILSIRAVTVASGGNPIQAGLLADASGAAAASNAAVGPMMEFIVRQGDGAIISVVQSNAAGFRTGDRVNILRDDRVHLARPG
jgi:outer membrane lipoprotein SlyB